MPIQRSFNSGQFAVELHNEHAGWVQSVDGGMPAAEVVAEKVGYDLITHKHIGPIKYDEINLKCGTGMSRGFYEWVQASLTQDFMRQNGAIITADYDYTELSRLNFFESLITEFSMPALDASAKDPASMSIKFAPEYTRRARSSGKHKISGNAYPTNQAKQKHWLPANFRVQIDGLADACRRVNKVDAVSVKQKQAEVPQAGFRDVMREPASIDFSNLVLMLPEADADPFYEWFQKFVVEGNCTDAAERTGSIEYLTTDLKTILFSVSFQHLGIFKITPDKHEAGAGAIRRVKVEMYCESMAFKYSQESVWA